MGFRGRRFSHYYRVLLLLSGRLRLGRRPGPIQNFLLVLRWLISLNHRGAVARLGLVGRLLLVLVAVLQQVAFMLLLFTNLRTAETEIGKWQGMSSGVVRVAGDRVTAVQSGDEYVALESL